MILRNPLQLDRLAKSFFLLLQLCWQGGINSLCFLDFSKVHLQGCPWSIPMIQNFRLISQQKSLCFSDIGSLWGSSSDKRPTISMGGLLGSSFFLWKVYWGLYWVLVGYKTILVLIFSRARLLIWSIQLLDLCTFRPGVLVRGTADPTIDK